MVPASTTTVVSVHFLWRVCLCLLISLTSFQSTSADGMSIKTSSYLFQSHSSHSFLFSPNGQHLAYIDANAALSAIVVSKLGHNIQTKRLLLKGDPPEQLYWLNADTLAYEVKGRLISINFNTMQHKLLLDNLNYKPPKQPLLGLFANSYRDWHIVNTLPKEPNTLIVAAKDKNNSSYIYRFNFVENKLQELSNGHKRGVNNWIVSHNGKVSLGLIEEKGQKTYLAKSGRNWSTLKSPLMFNFDGQSYLQRRTIFETVSFDEDIVYVSENLNSDKFKISAFSLSKNQILNTVLEDNYYDIGDDENPAKLLFNERTQELAGIHYHRAKPHSVWFDKTLAAMQKSLDKQLPNGINQIESWTTSMQTALIKSYDSSARHKVYVYYPAQQKLKLIADFSNPNKDKQMAVTQVLRFKARDGYELEAYLTLPNGQTGGATPLVVMPHGGPWTRDTWAYDAKTQFLASQGFATLKVNFRGSRGYGLAHLRAGIGEFAGLMLDDIADSAYWAIEQNITKADQVFIMGASYGGYASLMSGVRYPDLYQALVSNAAPIDLMHQFEHFEANDLSFAYKYWQKAVGDPKTNAAFIENISPRSHLSKLAIPALIYHGENDKTVPVWQAALAEKTLTRKSKSKVVIVPEEGHGFSQLENRLNYLSDAVNLFNSQL